MITLKGWLSFLGAAALLVCSAAPAALSYSLSAPAVLAGERASLWIRLPESDLTRPPGLDPDEPPAAQDDFLMRSSSVQVLDRDFKKEDGIYIWRYDVTAYKPGKITIPPIEIRLGPQSFSTQSMPLEIKTDEDRDLREEFPEIPIPFPWMKWGLFALGAGLAFWAFRRVRRWLRGRPQSRPVQKVVPGPPPESDLEWLRRRFNEIRQQLLRGEDDAAVDELTKVLRTYFSRRQGLPVTAWTTREFGHCFEQNENAIRLIPIFERCDEYKFAPHSTSAAGAVAELSLKESETILCS